MSELVNFSFRDMPALRVLGKAIRPKMDMQENPIPAFWGKCFEEGLFGKLEGMKEYVFDDAYVGVMCDWTGSDGTFTYICGMLMSADCPVPEGFDRRDIAAGTAAVGWVKGPEKENYMVAHTLTQGELERQGWKADEEASWCMELYNCPRFTQPAENGDVILDYYIPCKQA